MERIHHHHHEHHHHHHSEDEQEILKDDNDNVNDNVNDTINDNDNEESQHDHGHRHRHRRHGRHSHAHHSHGHKHHHEHGEGSMAKKLTLIIIAAVLLAGAYLIERKFDLPTWQLLAVYLVPYIIVGHHTIAEAVEGIVKGNPFNEHLLMTIATIGALAIGFMPGAEPEFLEAVFVMLFFQIGEMFEGYAEGRSRKSISHLMDIRPDTANLVDGDEVKTVSPDKVPVGSTILVRPGEKVPLDGTVTEGRSSLNTVALTGESMPRDVEPGSDVVSGCININGVLTMTTTKTFGESTVSKIINLVENAAEHKSASEDFISRFAHVYTPIVVLAALALAFVPPFFASDYMIEWMPSAISSESMTETVPSVISSQEMVQMVSSNTTSDYWKTFPMWLHRALIFLVVSCPCALVISVPLTFFGGIGGASRRGILIKGANYIDKLAGVHTVVFDKTGTLTNGTFSVDGIYPTPNTQNPSTNELLHLAAIVERHSTHPIAVALREADHFGSPADESISDYEEIAGHGIRAMVDGHVVGVGNMLMMQLMGVECEENNSVGTVVYVARDNEYLGSIVINDTIKEDSYDAASKLKKVGVRKAIMFTGDRDEVAADVAAKLALDDYYFDLLPQDKVKYIQKLMRKAQRKNKGRCVAFVGDGINDAPVLRRADVGIAMGAMGSDAAIEAADVVLMNDTPSSVATAIRIARRTIRIARQNVVFAIGVKLAVLVLAIFGLTTMGMAVFADVGVTVLAVLNAIRALR